LQRHVESYSTSGNRDAVISDFGSDCASKWGPFWKIQLSTITISDLNMLYRRRNCGHGEAAAQTQSGAGFQTKTIGNLNRAVDNECYTPPDYTVCIIPVARQHMARRVSRKTKTLEEESLLISPEELSYRRACKLARGAKSQNRPSCEIRGAFQSIIAVRGSGLAGHDALCCPQR
jgi:hypothetical protein